MAEQTFSVLLVAPSLLMVSLQPADAQNNPATSVQNSPAQIHALKVTLLSTMPVGSTTGLGEWGFSELIEADGHRVQERTLISCFRTLAI